MLYLVYGARLHFITVREVEGGDGGKRSRKRKRKNSKEKKGKGRRHEVLKTIKKYYMKP